MLKHKGEPNQEYCNIAPESEDYKIIVDAILAGKNVQLGYGENGKDYDHEVDTKTHLVSKNYPKLEFTFYGSKVYANERWYMVKGWDNLQKVDILLKH